jgi:hypothetical protein
MPYGEADMPWPWNINGPDMVHHREGFNFSIDGQSEQYSTGGTNEKKNTRRSDLSTPTTVHPPAYNVLYHQPGTEGEIMNFITSSQQKNKSSWHLMILCPTE